MKLVDLRRSLRGQRALVYFDADLLKQLKPYTQRRERSGFLDLSAQVLLALLNGSDESLESAADHLAVSCKTSTDLGQLAQDTERLSQKLWQRYDAAGGEK